MKRYVSLASAILVGTVFANEKKTATTTLAAKAVEGVSPNAVRGTGAMLEIKKPIYASDVSDLDENQDVPADKIPKDSIQSEKTSARDVAAKEQQSAQSSATSARVAIKKDVNSIEDSSSDNEVEKQASITSTPDDVERVDTDPESSSDENDVNA